MKVFVQHGIKGLTDLPPSLYRINIILFIVFNWGKIMRLTRAGEYAVRCITHLATQGVGVLTKRTQIAQAMDIPDQFLGKIAQQLAQAGLIEIVQGSKGGLRLVIPPSKVSMLDVIEAVIGEISLNDCCIRPASCERSNACIVHQIWQKARDQLRDTLAEATFDKLMHGERMCKPFCQS